MSEDVAGAAEAIVAAAFVDAVRDRLEAVAKRMGESVDATSEIALDAATEVATGVRDACPAVAADDVARVLVAVGMELIDMGLPHPVELVAVVLLLAANRVTSSQGRSAA